MSKQTLATDLLGEEKLKIVNTPIHVKKDVKKELTPAKIGDTVLFAIRAQSDGEEPEVFPAIVVSVKGTSAAIMVFRGNFMEHFTKIPQSLDLQVGFFTKR